MGYVFCYEGGLVIILPVISALSLFFFKFSIANGKISIVILLRVFKQDLLKNANILNTNLFQHYKIIQMQGFLTQHTNNLAFETEKFALLTFLADPK